MKTLKDLLDQVTSSEKFTENRRTIAEKLLRDYCIQKGNLRYDILEIEFYYFDKNHPDIITYPRDAESGDWFLHLSGVDLCFKSSIVRCFNEDCIEPNNNGKIDPQKSYFGGVLIRAIRRQNDGAMFLGPWNTCDELFLDSSVQRVSLVAKDDKTKPLIELHYRWFKFDTNKKRNDKRNDYIANTSIQLDIKLDAPYRYFISDSEEVSCQKLRNYKSSVKLNQPISVICPEPRP
jgi:hypothetical protein